jgi:uncharacterized protein YjeT (DUF2065 family)
MHAIIAVVGALIIVEGILFMTNPLLLDKLINFFLIGKRIYLGGVLRAVLTAIFLILARQCAHPWIIIIFGLVFMIGAIVIFALDPEKLKSILRYWLTQKILLKRLIGFIAFLIGLLLIYASVIKWP